MDPSIDESNAGDNREGQELGEEDGPIHITVRRPLSLRPETDSDPEEVHPVQDDVKVLDGGWGWVCAVSCAVSSVFYVGITTSFSIIFLVLVERFGQPAATTAWVYSFNLMFVMLGGPVATALMNRFGCRRCLAVAGVVYCAGLICTGFAPSLAIVFLGYSILAGFACSVPYTSVFVIIGEYFDKNRSKAIAIAMSGRGVGAIVFPLFLQTLLETFGFTGAFLILGGCFLNIVPLGMLLISPERNAKSSKVKSDRKPDEGLNFVGEETGAPATPKEKSEANELLARTEPAAFELEERIDRPNQQTQKPRSKESKLKGTGICAKVATALDLSLLKEPANLAFFCHLIFLSVGMSIGGFGMAGLAEGVGLSKQQAAWSISAFGAASIIGRFLAGIVFDLKAVRPHRFQPYAVGLFLFACTDLSSPLPYNFVTCLAFMVLRGSLIAAITNQEMVILADLVSKSRYNSAVGLATAFRGIGMLLGPPLGGLLRDISGSYVMSFVAGGGSVLLALLTFEANVLYRKLQSKDRGLYDLAGKKV